MKNIFNRSLSLLLTLSLLSCHESTTKENRSGGDIAQKMEFEIDGIKKTVDPTPITTSSYTNSHFILSYLSDKDDIQFAISAYMQELKIGSYEVYDCKSASECNDKVPDNNQIAMFAPYPRNPMPPINLSRTAYYAPRLGLKPLTLVITSIADEQQAGNPNKTKRIKGHFKGNLAYVEQQRGGYDYFVVGKTSLIDGKFEMFCSIM
jgi:hypothetical protein